MSVGKKHEGKNEGEQSGFLAIPKQQATGQPEQDDQDQAGDQGHGQNVEASLLDIVREKEQNGKKGEQERVDDWICFRFNHDDFGHRKIHICADADRSWGNYTQKAAHFQYAVAGNAIFLFPLD